MIYRTRLQERPKNLGLENENIKQKIIQQKLLKFFGKFTLNFNIFKNFKYFLVKFKKNQEKI